MECTNAREALSSLLDGEPVDASNAELTEHLDGCARCRGFLEQARTVATLAGRSRPVAPDVVPAVVARFRSDRGRRAHTAWMSALRLGLVAVGTSQLVLAVPGLLFGSDEGAPMHVAHEVGAWDLALAVAFVYAAWRPLRALGLLPFAAVLSAGLVLTAIVDLAHGRALALTESTHLLELVGTTLLYLLVAPRVGSRPEVHLRAV